MSKNSSSSSNMGCLDFLVILLTVLFIGLKLGGVIKWSWLWVLSPIWIYIIGIVLFIIVVAIIAVIVNGMD